VRNDLPFQAGIRAERQQTEGATITLNRVNVSPKRITKAMGAWISLPGFPGPCAIGTSASSVGLAVVKIAASRSEAPNKMARRSSVTPLCLNQKCRTGEMSVMPAKLTGGGVAQGQHPLGSLP
jgi:hypothetical protein